MYRMIAKMIDKNAHFSQQGANRI